ncbi:Virulence sensor protein BvgS precursor [Brevundimonas sp. SH203]|uniref:hybrid sensor histidine kinase/response regulator n=1 Tax=Brevundimonas sp. SH203 TaxID=345167 RepID=UPI0009D05DA8|nr:hybrid sensor histidine kinase/response regulator [Brevundimonas sp. SH203]GAW41580.1 Virulence sensor protein BvgS precursor [Brevundimonas sp. SH203]
MFSLLILGLVAAYMAILFAVAWYQERPATRARGKGLGASVYALSLAIYCTSWTYYGAVGTAARDGWEYMPIYIGPIIGVTLLFPLWRRIAAAARRENVGSVADFVASRYGKSQGLGAAVTLVAILGALPYIALQLKSLSMAGELLTAGTPVAGSERLTVLVLAGVLAFFAVLFGARRPDLTEHNRGLIQAIGLESMVKLGALLFVAVFALVMLANQGSPPRIVEALGGLAAPPDITPRFTAITLLSTLAIFCLPRQFHVAFVEGAQPSDVRRARWIFPLYLMMTSLAVLPLVAAGALFAPTVNPDLLVLALPFERGQTLLTAVVFVGGFSAATAMVIVEAVALSAMVSNSLILPFLARDRWRMRGDASDMAGVILQVRRGAIVAVLLLAWLYYQATDQSRGLAAMGLVSFAAMAQLAPALFGAVLWRGGHAKGALAGLGVGVLVWLILLALPQLTPGAPWQIHVMMGIKDPLALGVFLSLALNLAVYVGVSRLARPRLIDRVQARAFVDRIGPDWSENRPAPSGASVGDLRALVARFIGDERAERAFSAWGRETAVRLRDADPADAALARAAERMLAGAIGAASARRVIAAALAGVGRAPEDVVRMLDEASQAVQFNRDLLQTTLDNIDQGVIVVDEDLRVTAWNRRYVAMFDLPVGFVHVGLPIATIYRLNAERGESPNDIEAWVERRLEALSRRIPHDHERQQPDGRVLRSSGAPIPGGGYATSYTDITALRHAARQLEEANERLEARVADRTARLDEARRIAEDATASKTRFLAAASHDLLQPLHAARLFIAALKEEPAVQETASSTLAANADRAIDSAHRLLTALLNLSKLEAGGVRTNVTRVSLGGLFDDLRREFAPVAEAKGLRLTLTPTRLWVTSDRDLLRSMLQNLIANAIRYTDRGRVLVGARRAGDTVRLFVCDTGRGIPEAQQDTVFDEFVRLPGAAVDEPGAGLGLAIVKRLSHLLDHPLSLRSALGAGATFRIDLRRCAPDAAPEIAPPRDVRLPLAGLRVLCVDNEPVILEALDALLTRWGARPTLAAGVEAAEAAQGPFDAAVVDLHLGDGPEGFAVIDGLRAQGVRRIALVTANTRDGLNEQATAAGAVLLPKPIKPAALKAFLSS